MVMAKDVDELARITPGKKSHAIEAFSRALIAIPTIIADNAGLDSAELVAQLRAEHHKEGCTAGIDVISGSVSTWLTTLVNEIFKTSHRHSLMICGFKLLQIGDMVERGISEAFKVKQAVLLSATEAAEMIIRVDEIITCAPRKREDRMWNWVCPFGCTRISVVMPTCSLETCQTLSFAMDVSCWTVGQRFLCIKFQFSSNQFWVWRKMEIIQFWCCVHFAVVVWWVIRS